MTEFLNMYNLILLSCLILENGFHYFASSKNNMSDDRNLSTILKKERQFNLLNVQRRNN